MVDRSIFKKALREADRGTLLSLVDLCGSSHLSGEARKQEDDTIRENLTTLWDSPHTSPILKGKIVDHLGLDESPLVETPATTVKHSGGDTVLQVMIAGPGEVKQHIGAVKNAIHEWNSEHFNTSRVCLLPRHWETDASPDSSGPAQEVINSQLVASCDMLVGIFWTRIGTPTANAESGTVDEINQFIESGRPVLLYFSKEPMPQKGFDNDQREKLLAFKEEMKNKAFFREFNDSDDLARQVRKNLTHHVGRRIQGVTSSAAKHPTKSAGPYEQLKPAIELLWRARHYAKTAKAESPWQHAVAYADIIRTGSTKMDIGWLMDKRYATTHREESRMAGAGHKKQRPPQRLHRGT